MKACIILLISLTTCISLAAQTITGKITDEQQQPIGYVNIVLQQADSTFVTGTVSDEKGNSLSPLPEAETTCWH